MSKLLWKNFHLWFCKLKCLPSIEEPPYCQEDFPYNPLSSSSYSSSTALTTLPGSSTHRSTSDDALSSSEQTLPDFSSLFSHRRFFFSSPGRSNSILDSPRLPSASDHRLSLARSVKITKFSNDPYADFRSSMQEMIDSREVFDVRIDWSYLHDLLLSYLQINPKSTHKFIIRAFSDVLVTHLAPSSESVSADYRPEPGSHLQQFYIAKT